MDIDLPAAGPTAVFISSARDEQLRSLVRLLTAHGYAARSALDAPAGDFAAVRSQIESANYVIVAIADQKDAVDAAYALGQTSALGKPTLILAPAGVSVPADVQDAVVLREVADPDAVLDALQALAQIDSVPSDSAQASSRSLGERADRYRERLAEVRATPEPGASVELERLVHDALAEAGVRTIVASSFADYGFDLAVWDKDLEPYVGAPLLVELVSDRLHDRRAVLKVREFSAAVQSAPTALWGLLVLASEPPSAVREAVSEGPLLVITIDSLLSGLRTARFADVIRDLRNRRVHG